MQRPSLAELDKLYLWHPFTQMKDWIRGEPIVIVEGDGAVLRDANGREYLDANASIWTNLHGHNHPQLNAAIGRQLKKIAHSSALGFASEPASLLAAQLVGIANFGRRASPSLRKVFLSDNGSTAMEVALKLAYEFTRRIAGNPRPRFLSLEGAYHGDTVGAVALGHIDLFHRAYSGLLFRTDKVMAPYCYRCPFNRAAPERADARDYRRCAWQCLDKLEQKFKAQTRRGRPYAAFVFEPLMQGAAGMIPQPSGWLNCATAIAREHRALLIADEVMTGFGRTGFGAASRDSGRQPGAAMKRPCHVREDGRWKMEDGRKPGVGRSQGRDAKMKVRAGSDLDASPRLFACHQEGVHPDFMALAKGLTGGYLPMAATLTTQAVFDAFLGTYEEFKTFFHGHSFTGNQVGAAAALASLQVLQSRGSIDARQELEQALRNELGTLWSLPAIGDIRQVGLVAGIELVRNWRTREPYQLDERAGIRVCEGMAKRGVLTRPIGNMLVLMPPYCTTSAQIRKMVGSLREAVEEELLNSGRIGAGARTSRSARV
jgi:adenosylmethionine-8-amino-7-oxononanoate aminotransferase